MKYPYKIRGNITTITLVRRNGVLIPITIDTEDISKLTRVTSMYALGQIGGIPRIAIRIGSGKNQIR